MKENRFTTIRAKQISYLGLLLALVPNFVMPASLMRAFPTFQQNSDSHWNSLVLNAAN